MSSLINRKDGGKQQVSVVVDGQRIKRSLGDIPNKEAVVDALQSLADGIHSPSVERLKRLCGAVFDAAGVTPFWEVETVDMTLEKFLHQWLSAKKPSFTKDRLLAHANVFKSVCEFNRLGKTNLRQLTLAKLTPWFDAIQNAGSTRNQKAAMLAQALEDAVADRLLNANPARRLKAKADDGCERLAFPDESLKVILDWLPTSGERYAEQWVLAILIARWTGLRMMDVMGLHGRNFPTVKGVRLLSLKTAKTGEELIVPLLAHTPSVSHLGDNYLFPHLRLKSKSQLSQSFARFLVKSGVQNETSITASGRTQSAFTFHSLRHSFVTWLNNMDYDEATRMKLVGHKSAKVHAGYNHRDLVMEALELHAKL